MANSDKDIKITPNTNQGDFPKIEFIGSSSAPITLSVLDDNTISFSGSEGQLFSINNNLTTGIIFSVNNVSGLPILEASASGDMYFGEFGGKFGIGTTNPAHELSVVGHISASVISGSIIESTKDVIVDDSTRGIVLKSPDANYWRITVDNAGSLTVASLGTTKPT